MQIFKKNFHFFLFRFFQIQSFTLKAISKNKFFVQKLKHKQNWSEATIKSEDYRESKVRVETAATSYHFSNGIYVILSRDLSNFLQRINQRSSGDSHWQTAKPHYAYRKYFNKYWKDSGRVEKFARIITLLQSSILRGWFKGKRTKDPAGATRANFF